MKLGTKIFLTTGVIVGLAHGAFAADITVSDGSTHPGIGPGFEDQENEPAASFAQKWDLEALVLEGSTLSIIGGFPMLTHNSGFSGFKLGDLFIDTDGNFVGPPLSRDVQPEPDTFLRNGDFGYEYVVRFNRTGTTSASQVIVGFDVIKLTDNSRLRPIMYPDGMYPTLDDSNPYQYKDEEGGALIDIVGSGSFSYVINKTDQEIEDLYDVVVKGDVHNVLTLDFNSGINPLLLASDLHLTMGCGNDNILGHLSGGGQDAPDGGATLVLLGLGLASLTFVGRKTVKA